MECSLNTVNLLCQVAMRALGFDVKKADVQKVLRDYDRDETGKVTFDDFNDVSKSLPVQYYLKPENLCYCGDIL